jgi:hypothetical protein
MWSEPWLRKWTITRGGSIDMGKNSKKIRNKKEYLDLAVRGLCGNCMPIWRTLAAYEESGFEGLVGIRCTDASSGKFRPWIEKHQVREAIAESGLEIGEYYLCPSPLPERCFQGEFSFVEDYELCYSYFQGTLREAMLRSDAVRATGIEALNVLRANLPADEYEDLRDLLDRYTVRGEAPVIEFSRFKKPYGIFPRSHTIIWEIRHY